MRKADRIAAKSAHVQEQVHMLERGARAATTVGGRSVAGQTEELEFQRRRRAELEWARRHTIAQIRARIDAHEASVRPEALACKYGDVRGLSAEEVEAVAMIELLEIALGTHPGVK